MKPFRILIAVLACGIVALSAPGQEVSRAAGSGKKLVEYGWDVPTPAYVADHIREMEKRPFDGVLFRLEITGRVFEPAPIDEAQLAKDNEAIDRIRWDKFTDNFVMMYAASKQDWFNDDHWKVIEHNTALVARAAKRAKCVGVCFDPEPYGSNPWIYRKVNARGEVLEAVQRGNKSFVEFEAKVRQRGAQFVKAIEREFPDAKILTFFHVSKYRQFFYPMSEANRVQALEGVTYALLPAFVEGMVKGADTRVEVIDGNEKAYYYTQAQEYLDLYHAVTQRARYFVSPDAWPAYHAKVRMGQALYIDQYYGLRKNIPTLGNVMTPEDQAKWFEHNVYWALYTTDRYAWCYSERMNWWKDENIPPGAEEAIRKARAAIESGSPLSFDLAPIIEAAESKFKELKK